MTSMTLPQIHRMSFQLKQILEHDKLDLLDTDHIISENRLVRVGIT